MKAYQLRIGIKRYKPATWWRCVVPGGITYSQLSLILTDVMGIDSGEEFIFEFYRRKLRLYEGWESRRDMRRVNYSTGRRRSSILTSFWTRRTGSASTAGQGKSGSCG